jgi:L-lactate utilization protein LutC
MRKEKADVNRDEFFARVSTAAAGRAYRVHVDPNVPESVGYVGGGDDLSARLAAEVTAVGGQSVVADDLTQARKALAEIMDRYEPKRAFCWEHPLLARLEVDALLSERGIACCGHASLAPLPYAEQREQMLAADIGITSASFAIAETGSLAMMSRPHQERLASLLPPVHVAIVERSQILPDLFDLFSELARAGYDALPSNLALITGPSKTGDIELTLTTGVHGPGAWHVIIVR